jgi:hypothetical protein
MESDSKQDRENGSRHGNGWKGKKPVVLALAYSVIVLIQLVFALWGIDNFWQRGHNGYNGAALRR